MPANHAEQGMSTIMCTMYTLNECSATFVMAPLTFAGHEAARAPPSRLISTKSPRL